MSNRKFLVEFLCELSFDKENGTLLIQDPLDGLVERDAETFAKYYEELGKNAMIIH